MANWTFKTPTIDEGPLGTGRLFSRFKLKRGISIVKIGSVYSQTRYLDADNFAGYSEYYQGGGTFTVSDATRTALIAANIGIDSTNFTA